MRTLSALTSSVGAVLRSSHKLTCLLFLLVATAAILTKINYQHLFSGWYLWMEDGTVFLDQAASLGFASFWKPSSGYLHLYIRLVAWIATRFSLTLQPPLFFLGWFFAYGIFLLFLFRAGRTLQLSLFSLLLLALLLPLQPDNKSGEALFNLTNSQWVLSAGWMLWAVVETRPISFSLVKVVGLALLGLTGPYALVIAPVLMLKVFILKDFRKNSWIYLTLFGCACVQAFFITKDARKLGPSGPR